MITKDGFFEDCGFSTLRHLRSEQITTKRELTEEIEPWYLRDSKEVKRANEKKLFWERSSDNASDLTKNKSLGSQKERPRHPKCIYRLAKINPEISCEPLAFFSRRDRPEVQALTSNNMTVSKPFKQMRQQAEAKEVWQEESWPERRQNFKEPGKSVYLALFKYKQLKIKDSLMREKLGEQESGANLNRYSLLSHLPDEDCLQKMPTIARKLEINRSRRGKVVAVGLQKMNTQRKKTMDLLIAV